MEMIIQKRFKDPGAGWEETTLKECLDKTAGYWKKENAVIEALQGGWVVQTPFALYRCTEYTIDGITRTNKF